MRWAMDRIATRALHVLPPETAHNFGLLALGCIRTPTTAAHFSASLRTNAMGLTFASPIGLAAGFDKNALALGAFARFGWGFVEIGGITPHQQPGNPKPRLFRLPNRTVVNRMGFNSQGLRRVQERLRRRPPHLPLFANLGANRETPDPADDWRILMRGLAGEVDAYVLNVSSPNTATLQDVRHPAALDTQLPKLVSLRDELARENSRAPPPLLIKLSPDHADSEYAEIGELCLQHGIDGIIATNSSARLCAELAEKYPKLSGGLSGQPLRARAAQVMHLLRRAVGSKLTLIGVGGIATAADAYERIRAGATLIQIYSAIVWEGPCVAARMAEELAVLLERDGFDSITNAVGADLR